MEKLPSIIHESWHPFLQPIFDESPDLERIRDLILPNCTYFPEMKNIFRVFSMPMQDIKVVILGQDPYPIKGDAIGYAFAVDGNKFPASLRIIQNEIFMEIEKGLSIDESLYCHYTNSDETHFAPEWRSLEHWTKQGVFLLNTALTVEQGKAGSHIKYWEMFTWKVIRIIAREVAPIWMLWGRKAQEVITIIQSENYYSNVQNVILEAPHPAAEAYAGGHAGFYGCNHFTIVNEILIKQNKQVINW